jgi:hypothetical protein
MKHKDFLARIHPTAWAWRLEEGDTCKWASPSKSQLTFAATRPSPTAKMIQVRIVPIEDYRAMDKASMLKISGSWFE